MIRPELVRGLWELAKALPAGTPVPVPQGVLIELLEESDYQMHPAGEAADPTVETIAARYGRAASTVRGWCEAGRFPGAYKLGREWRIPAAGVSAFEAALRGSATANGRDA